MRAVVNDRYGRLMLGTLEGQGAAVALWRKGDKNS